MQQVKKGDHVSLKRGLKTGDKFDAVVMLADMRFRGKSEVLDVYESGLMELENNYIYHPDMIQEEKK